MGGFFYFIIVDITFILSWVLFMHQELGSGRPHSTSSFTTVSDFFVVSVTGA